MPLLWLAFLGGVGGTVAVSEGVDKAAKWSLVALGAYLIYKKIG
jgi:hypothetical protein